MKKLLFFMVFLCLFVLFSSCDNNDTNTQSAEDTSVDYDTNTSQKDAQTDNNFVTDENDRGLLDMYKIKKAAELYAEAANKVKGEGAGFTRSQWQKISNIQTGDTTGIAANVLNIVAENLLTNESDAFGSEASTVPKGNINRINLLFPIYNRNYACILEDKYDCIKSASFTKKDGKYEVRIDFADIINAEQDMPGFGQIMTPFVRAEILNNIEKYLIISNLTSPTLDFVYRDCYLTCVIEAGTLRMISLEQHITAELSASAELSILGFMTNFLNGTATIENHLYFYDFSW